MVFIELLKAILFGFVEGVTEWLPVSSTGHLILVQEFVQFKGQNEAFMNMFNIVIQLGAILAVMVIYFERLNPFQKGKSAQDIRLTWQLWLKVVIAILPALVLGLSFDDFLEKHLYHFVPVALMLILYGVIFTWLENRQATLNTQPQVTSLAKMSYKTAFLIGCFQVLSLIPGTSRSGATIIGGMLVGASRSVATEFTFFLGIPVMFGYSGLKILKFFLEGNGLTFSQLGILLTAMLTAFGVSMVAIRFLTAYVRTHDFKVFGYYRIALGILLLMYWVGSFFIA
ncbi:undecaprenyl-diphosphate phosphatase [Streptococcus sp. E17BB]|uniref:undecaprenyl-diphosphate phosphatase n=1 Tax=Streptococcus sp. E17BB TaxID=3278714 RepID=UPI00359DA24A